MTRPHPATGTILDTIVKRKHEEIAERRARVSADELERRVANAPVTRGFSEALVRAAS